MARPLPSLPLLVGIGLAGGFFSALFGVGGGIVVVPLLVLAAGLGAKEATGTSLAAIMVTATFGVIAFAALGEVKWQEAAIVGLPAMAGTLAGTALQQRVSSRLLTLLFAAFLLAVAVRLFLE
ncbi:MAG TPA: sulfite exporter TauE/SafE family protein [Gaiellaceae bacterium]|nr:sulfite exporter TauE/SafE family protein [Gaiellaceae bacterium]